MSGRGAGRAGRAATTIGVASVASAAFLAVHGDPWGFVPMTTATAAVAVVLGVLTVVAGGLRRALPIALAGVAFCLSAAVVLVQLATGTAWLGGNASTLSLWLGFGVGLLAVSYAVHDERRHT